MQPSSLPRFFNDAFRGRRVLVLGHTGFKGSWLSQWLMQLGAEVAGFSLGVPSNPSHFETLGHDQKLRNYQGDVRNLAEVKSAFREFRPEIVFHLAAQAIVRASYVDPKTTFDTNVGGMVNVLEALRESPETKAAVLITSDKCYENVEWDYGYRETDRLGGKDPYSASKAAAEIVASSYIRSFFTEASAPRVATTRAGNVIGGGDWASDRIVPDCIRAWARGEAVPIRSPKSTRPWQHVLEPLSGYLWLGARLLSDPARVHGESFNFGPDATVNQPVEKLLDTLRKVWTQSTWLDQSDRQHFHEAGLLKLCCDKALATLGWTPNLSFDESARMTASWYWDYYREKRSAAALTGEQIEQYQNWAFERRRVWAQPQQ